MTIDAAGRIVQFNAAAERLFGLSREVAIGRPLRELVTGGAIGVRAVRAERQAVRGDGVALPVELTVAKVADAPRLLTAFIRDVSDLRRAEDRESRMQRLLTDAEALAHIGSWELDLRTQTTIWSDELYRIHGYEPGTFAPGVESIVDLVHRDDRPVLAALLSSMLEHPERLSADGIDVEYRAVRRDGSVRRIRARGRVDRDPRDRPVRWLGSAQDITDQRLAERELHAHYAVEQALRDWETFEEGVMGLLRRLGTALEFAMGSLWTPDDDELLTCRAFWSAPDVDPGEFETVTRTMAFRPGEGIPGMAWKTQQPVIGADLDTMPAFRRADAAERVGLRSGLAFPAVAEEGPLAVLSYYSYDRRQPSTRLARTLTGIGRELGRFLARRRPDLGMRRPSDRELEVLRLAAAGNTGPQIAEQLVLSPATVKTHFENLYEKLGVSDRAAAVAYALRNGLID